MKIYMVLVKIEGDWRCTPFVCSGELLAKTTAKQLLRARDTEATKIMPLEVITDIKAIPFPMNTTGKPRGTSLN